MLLAYTSIFGEFMRRLFLPVFILIMAASLPASAAQKVKVTALTPFNSLNPVSTMKVITLEKAEFDNGIVFEDGTVIYGDIIDIKQPKRAKRNASFKFKPTSYMYNGQTHTINDPKFIAKYSEYKQLDKAELATSAAATAGGFLFHIPLLSESVSFLKGVVKNPEDNRLKSGAVQVYKDSIFSYVEEGKDIDLKENTMFVLKFKSSDLEDLDDDEQQQEPAVDNEQIIQEPAEESATQQQDTASEAEDNTEKVPVIRNEEEKPVKHIKAVDPEDVLKEVELNTK